MIKRREETAVAPATIDRLELRRAGNGGWVIKGNTEAVGDFDAAYSNTEEMIAGLTGMLRD